MRKENRDIALSFLIASAVFGACTALKLSSTQQLMMSFSENPYNFGPVDVGLMVTHQFTLSPVVMGNTDTITSITPATGACMVYGLSAQGLPGAQVYYSSSGFCASTTGSAALTEAAFGSGASTQCTYSFSVTFSPASVGEADCDFNINYTDSSSTAQTTTLHLMGSGNQPYGFSASSPILFGNIPVGTMSTPGTLRVKNTGTNPITVSGTKTGDGTPPAISPNSLTTVTLPVNGSHDYAIQCDPPNATNYTATYQLTGTPGSVFQTSQVSCTGIDTTLAVSPAPIAFAPSIVGVPPTGQSVTISGGNGVTDSVVIALDANAAAAGITMTPASPLTVSLFSSKTVTLNYDAHAAQSGALGQLVVTLNAKPPYPVTINGETDEALIATNPTTADFGPVCIGDTAKIDVMVYGLKTGSVPLTGVTGGGGPFTVQNASGLVMGNHQNEIGVHTTVTPTAPGDGMATMTLAMTNPSQMTQDVMLHVTGLQAGITGTPDQVHFGGVTVGTTTPAKSIVMTNCSGTDLMIDNATIDGPNASEFTIVDPVPPMALLHSTESKAFLVVMSTRTVGPKSATLTFTHDAGTTVVALDGDATGDTTGTGKDRETYYACAASRPAAAWPIALAMLLIRRRRHTRRRA